MGAISSRVAVAQKPVTARSPRVRYTVRCDEVTAALLEQVERARREGRLMAVTVDCRSRPWDDESVEELTRAVGTDKLVLDL